MTWVLILKLFLELAAFAARRAEKKDIESAILAGLETLHGKRVDAAVSARDDVISGRLQPDDNDKYRRD